MLTRRILAFSMTGAVALLTGCATHQAQSLRSSPTTGVAHTFTLTTEAVSLPGHWTFVADSGAPAAGSPQVAEGGAMKVFHPSVDANGNGVAVTVSLGRLTDNDRSDADPATGAPGPLLYVNFPSYLVTYHNIRLPQGHGRGQTAPPPVAGTFHVFVDARTGLYMEGMTDPSNT